MDIKMRDYISLFERKEIDTFIIDDILSKDHYDQRPDNSINEAIEILQDYFHPTNYSDDVSIAYTDGVYHGIEVSVNILKSILNKREN